MIRLLALDLDGTLLTEEKIISEKNKEVLKKAEAKGVKVVITTGRPLQAVLPFIDALEQTEEDYAITFNGGLVQNVRTGEILAKKQMETEDILITEALFKEIGLPLSVIAGRTVYELNTAPQHPSIYQTLNPLLTYVPLESSQELPKDVTFNKMISAVATEYLDEKIPLIPATLKERFEIMKSRVCLLEILPKGVSKANGLKALGEKLGISSAEMMSFGDEENDRSMIEYAGMGVVMANGNPKMKEIANFVTKSNEEDGVAYAVEKFVLKGEI